MEKPRRIGKYEVVSQIASGGFGVIYKGWDPFIKRPVAIKLCLTPDEEVRRRFEQEAQFVGNLVHRNITLVFDYGVENGLPYIVQKDYQGVSGTIKVARYDEGVISGTFSGTLGQWPIGADPEKEPPSATVTISDGYFKYSGKRIQGK